MDGETIRLVATAIGAVIAGLGGALIAGAFNSENTQATLAAAKAQWDKDRDLEHAQWLRERKVEVYSEFLNKLREIDVSMSELSAGIEKDSSRLPILARNLMPSPLRLYASDQVREAADAIFPAIAHAMQTLADARRDGHERPFKEASHTLIQRIIALESAVRADLVDSGGSK